MKSKIMNLIDKHISVAEDNELRAKMQFQGLNDDEMENEYGQSGIKCKDVLAGAEAKLKEAKDMKTWFFNNT